MSKNKKQADYNNGIIDGITYCEEEEKKLMRYNDPKSKRAESGLFKMPDLNE